MPIDEQEKDRPGKVFVGGLTPDVTEEDLEKKFTAYGRVTEGTNIFNISLLKRCIDSVF